MGSEQLVTESADAGGTAHDEVALVVVDVGGRRCALPADRVLEIHAAVTPIPLPGAPDVVLGVVNRRGDVVAVIDTRRRFGLPSRNAAISDCLVFVEACGRTMGLLVDAALDLSVVARRDIDVAATSTVDAAYASGVVVLPGQLAMIADLDAFLSAREAMALDEAVAASGRSGSR